MIKYKLKTSKTNTFGEYWQGQSFNKHLELTNYQLIFKEFVKLTPKGSRVLEAGCGTGRWVIPLCEKGYETYGVEISATAIELIKNNYKNANLFLLNGDIMALPYADNYFDSILSLGVLEHFEAYQDIRKALLEKKRLLKKEGLLFVTVPYASFFRLLFHLPQRLMITLIKGILGRQECFNEYRFGKKEVSKIIESAGFHIERVMWDELEIPYNFGLFSDFKCFQNKDKELFKLNKLGIMVYKTLSFISPSLVSGAICLICKKK